MADQSRQETERQLEQTERLARDLIDTLTAERLRVLIAELKRKLERDRRD
jgi:hypothetical protein